MGGFRRYAVLVIAALVCGAVTGSGLAAAIPLDPVAVLCTGSADGSRGTCGRWTGSSHYRTGTDTGRSADEVPGCVHNRP